ncbi:hypothetical protein LTR06_011087 [Exophiala xenobiotica]|nr:hypothetical protein LTR06_011087 [Exophiala xenobiotica]
MPATLTAVKASQRLDSRGKPTVQVVEMETKDGKFRAIVPSGASKSDYEAIEAVRNGQEIIGPALLGRKFDLKLGLKEIDYLMNQAR